MTNPMVSVVICTYNGLEDLREVIDDLLAQTYDNYEILIVDNNSTDGTGEYVQQKVKTAPRIRYCVETQQGKSFALNRSIEEAHGELLAFLDQDCRVGRDWVARIVDCCKNSNADGVGGIVEKEYLGNPSWLTLQLERAGVLPGSFYRGDAQSDVEWLMGCNMCFRRRVFQKVGGFHTAVVQYALKKGYGHEVDFCTRAREAGFRLIYDPSIRVRHKIPPQRQTLRYALTSAFWIGVANSLIQRPVNRQAARAVHPLKILVNIFSAAGRIYASALRMRVR